MTELTCTAIYVPNSIPNDDTGSIGFLFPGCEGRLLDDEGREAGIGEPGEVHIRGPNVCLGYWQNDLATTDTIDDEGWLRTGDIAVVDNNGMFWIVDRKKVGRSIHSPGNEVSERRKTALPSLPQLFSDTTLPNKYRGLPTRQVLTIGTGIDQGQWAASCAGGA